MTITVELMVNQEVHYCVSSLVATLGRADYNKDDSQELQDLKERALELSVPVDDYEEAARHEGWDLITFGQEVVIRKEDMEYSGGQSHDWQSVCEGEGIEPNHYEVYEHWLISDWLGKKLQEAGERVDMGFVGMSVWARTTTGQGIAQDAVIQRIHADLIK